MLANRGDVNAMSALELLTKDPNSMVESCALGALEYLRANKAT